MKGLFAAAVATLLSLHGGEPRQTGTVVGALTSPNAPTGGAVVYLVPADAGVNPPPLDSVVMDQQNLRFLPRVQVVTPGTIVSFTNSDPVRHNVFSPPRVGADFDLGTYTRAEVRVHRFDEPGAYLILCHVHPEMVAWVVAVPTPWYAIVGDDGQFRVTGVPAGRYVVHVWQRYLRDPARSVTVAEGATVHLGLSVERTRRPRPLRLDDPEGK